MTKILNTWRSGRAEKKEYYELNEPIYTNGDWAIYHQWHESYIYTYKNVAVNNLAGLNKDHLDALAKNQRPDGEYSPKHFLFDMAMENRAIGLSLLKN